jgi:hypothetical protein
MEHLIFPFGFAFAGLGILGAIASLAYPILVLWMIIDGILRVDAEYPGTEPNRKIFWVLGMVIVHPVAIVYFIVVFLRVRRTRRVAQPQYTVAPQYAAGPQYGAPQCAAAPQYAPAPPAPPAPPAQ